MRVINIIFKKKLEICYYLTVLLLLISLILRDKFYYFLFILIYMVQNSFIDVFKHEDSKKINNILFLLNLGSFLFGVSLICLSM